MKQDIADQINKIVLLKLKTLSVVKNGNLNLLLSFAYKKTPDLASKIYQEMESLGQKLAQPIYA